MKNLNKILTKSFLIKKYAQDKKSTHKIAKMIGCDHISISIYLKKYNIQRRTISEATKGIRKSPKTEFKKGMIPWNKGLTKETDERIEKISESRKGNKNSMFGVHRFGKDASNWQGGKSFEPYPIEWNKNYKDQIRKRDNYTCQLCNKKEIELTGFHRKLSIHHIDYDKSNLNPNNLISLCRKCHLKTNGNRNYWFAYFTYIIEEAK